MDLYGSDKPDLRFEMKMVNLTEDLRDTKFSVFGNAIKNGGVVKAICCQGGAKLTRSQIDELTEMVKKEGAGGLAYIVYDDTGKTRLSPSRGRCPVRRDREGAQNSDPLSSNSYPPMKFNPSSPKPTLLPAT